LPPQTLADIEIASKLMSKGQDIDENPIDTHYKALNTQLLPLDPNDDEYKIIQDYVKNSHAPTHTQYTLELQDVFSVIR
jgi:poly [ADP-ribose] polymerase